MKLRLQKRFLYRRYRFLFCDVAKSKLNLGCTRDIYIAGIAEYFETFEETTPLTIIKTKSKGQGAFYIAKMLTF